MAMQLISEQTLLSLLQQTDASILEYHAQRPKVIETKDETILKLFHPKHWYSSNTIVPYALRFTKNANRLATMGLVVPNIINLRYCAALKIYAVEYPKIPGDDLGTLMKQGQHHLLLPVIKFIAKLHAYGVYFRAIHLSNLIYQGPDNFAMIDITDLQIKSKSLSVLNRYRNLKHLFSNKTDNPYWLTLGIDKALAHYAEHANLSTLSCKWLNRMLRRKFMK